LRRWLQLGALGAFAIAVHACSKDGDASAPPFVDQVCLGDATDVARLASIYDAEALAADGAGVYWMSTTKSVWFVPSGGRDAIQLGDPNTGGSSFALDADRVYWWTSTEFYWSDRTGENYDSIDVVNAVQATTFAVTIDARYAYFAGEANVVLDAGYQESNVLYRVPLGTNRSPERIAVGRRAGSANQYGAPVVANGNFYWFEPDGLMVASVAGGEPMLLAATAGPPKSAFGATWPLYVDGRGACWVATIPNDDGGHHDRLDCLLFDGSPSRVLVEAPAILQAVLDGDEVFWEDFFGLHRVSRAGGTPITVTVPLFPHGFAIYGDDLYWADSCNGGVIRKAPKYGK
jgi:hypothetical protein